MTTPRRAPEVLLRRYWEDPDTPVVTAGLSALSLGYRGALRVRDLAYRFGILRTGRLPCAVVSVGNLTLGGSGKTPTVELVVRTLPELGAVPAVVSRGYGRVTRGVHVVADREGVRADARTAGDEPLLLAERLPGVAVVVGENRYEAGRVAVERLGATALVLDDGFQHRTLAKDLEILVVQGRAPWGNARVFPRGMLREPLAGLARAHAIVVTNPAGPAAGGGGDRDGAALQPDRGGAGGELPPSGRRSRRERPAGPGGRAGGPPAPGLRGARLAPGLRRHARRRGHPARGLRRVPRSPLVHARRSAGARAGRPRPREPRA